MKIMKTKLENLSNKDILNFINDYERDVVPHLNDLYEYSRGRNPFILNRRSPDENNPDHKIPISYGKKIITTYVGYAFRPKYITYKGSTGGEYSEKTVEDCMNNLQKVFNKNNEHIKTTRAGKDCAIFGVAYEMIYLEREVQVKEGTVNTKAEPRFFSVDPREMILLYDQSSEPKKKIAIRFYKVEKNHYKVEVIYKDRIELFDRKKEDLDTEWKLVPAQGTSVYPHIFGELPIIAYYMDSSQDSDGIIESVIPLIDAYDILSSDSMNEFSRFSYAYMVMKEFGLTDSIKKKDPATASKMLKFIKRFRLFEWVPKDADISFLTKDIPSEFIRFMAEFLREQIHIQSHVPDFTSDKMAGASGIAIKRLLFDFENVVSTAEAEFDIGLQNRIQLLITALEANKTAKEKWFFDMIIISHKRNIPLDLNEIATTAKTMKDAGFSSWLIADIMPDDIIPNVQEELDRQKEEREQNIPDVFQNNPFKEEEEEEREEEREEE